MFEKPLEVILSQGGVWAAVAVIAFLVAGYLQRQLSTCWKERIEEAKALLEIIHVNTTTISALTASFDARTRAAETTARAQELTAAELASVKAELARLYEATRKT